jgi:hypothetical protein
VESLLGPETLVDSNIESKVLATIFAETPTLDTDSNTGFVNVTQKQVFYSFPFEEPVPLMLDSSVGAFSAGGNEGFVAPERALPSGLSEALPAISGVASTGSALCYT